MRCPKDLVVSTVIVSCLVLAAGSPTAQKPPETARAGAALHRSSLEWIQKEKFRAVYCHRWCPEELPAKVAGAGFNTLHVQFCHGGYDDIKRWGRLARENNLRLITSIWWSYPAHRQQQHGTDSGIGGRYRGFVNQVGRLHTRTVCPVDEQYWDDWIVPGMREMARRAGEARLVGIAIDPELYGSAEPDGGGAMGWYYFAGMCFCDRCFGEFLQGIGAAETPANVPPAKRKSWLEKRDLLEPYEARLTDNVQTLARRLEEIVHAIDPNLLLGFLAVYDAGDFFSKGLREGLKTPDCPVMIWTETPTYRKGYHPYVDKVYERFQAVGDVIYIPGLWLEAHPPLGLPEQAHDLAMHSNGYWVFVTHKDLHTHRAILDYFKLGNEKIQGRLNSAPFPTSRE